MDSHIRLITAKHQIRRSLIKKKIWEKIDFNQLADYDMMAQEQTGSCDIITTAKKAS